VGDGGAMGEGAIAGEAGRESTANKVDGKLRMGKGIEEGGRILTYLRRLRSSKEASKEGVVASSREWRGCQGCCRRERGVLHPHGASRNQDHLPS